MLKCLFSCQACGLAKVEFVVAPRRPGEELTAFVNRAAAEAEGMHAQLSPRCPSRKVDIHFPAPPDGKRFGEA